MDIKTIEIDDVDIKCVVLHSQSNISTASPNVTNGYEICYGQNRIFKRTYRYVGDESKWETIEIVCDFAVIPELDELLRN